MIPTVNKISSEGTLSQWEALCILPNDSTPRAVETADRILRDAAQEHAASSEFGRPSDLDVVLRPVDIGKETRVAVVARWSERRFLPTKNITDAPFFHGDIVRLPHGELVIFQAAIYPPMGDDRLWHCHPQSADGKPTGETLWTYADLSVTTIADMIPAEGGNRHVWRGGFVAVDGKTFNPDPDVLRDYLARLDAYRVYRDVPPKHVNYIAGAFCAAGHRWSPLIGNCQAPACGERKASEPSGVKWSGEGPPPAIGATITVAINRIGKATVHGYFIENDWLGLLVVPVKPPAWYVKQNGRDAECHVFGVEIRP